MQLKNVASGTFRKSVNNVKSAASTYFAIVLPPQRERLGAREWDLVLYPFDWLGLNGRGSLDIRYVSRLGQAAAVGLGEKTLFPASFALDRGGEDGRGGRTGSRFHDVER